DPAGEFHRHRDTETSIDRNAVDFDALPFQLRYGRRDVVAHERDFVSAGLSLRVAFRRMHAEFRGRQREDQPSAARIHVLEAKDIAQYRTHRFRLRRVEQHMSTDDGHLFYLLVPMVSKPIKCAATIDSIAATHPVGRAAAPR